MRRLGARDRILEAAERLFAERGLAAVSLNEINNAARQRNTAAVHYHFKSKPGLLDAVLAPHLEAIDTERRARLDALELDGDASLTSLVGVLVEPLAERLDSDSGRAFLQIQAQIPPHERPAMPAARRLAALVGRGLGQGFPAEIAVLRGDSAQLLLFPALAERARREATDRAAREDRALFVENLIDVLLGVLTAPASAATRARAMDVHHDASA